MISLITGIIGIALVCTFLGYYAITLKSLPLWIVIISVLLLALFDLWLTTRDTLRRKDEAKEESS